ncbi:MAG: hypothetical protein QNK37_24315 [Acidobacteriota bacterium]|nr:hypothetical protein [Acidobacteriota bacterium]
MISKMRLVALCLLVSSLPLFAAEFVIINNDDPGVGLNDPTPADPIGGNTGTTLGEQRLQVLERVAEIWGGLLESDATIVVQAQTTFFDCSGNSTTLATAGTTFIFHSFPEAPLANIWYHSALTDALSGLDRNPGEPDIQTQFNLGLDEDPECVDFGPWYLGLDQEPNGQGSDLLATMLHEFAHGLGFANFVTEATGALQSNRGDIYSQFVRDLTVDKIWNDMTNAERAASAINDPNVVWTGANATAMALDLLIKQLTAGSTATGNIATAEANFGEKIRGPLAAEVVLSDDGVGDSTTDGCSALVNNVNGKIALIDRGICEFGVKALNAQNAGAVAAIIVNNQPDEVFNMGSGEVGNQVTIPAAMIRMEDGQVIKDALTSGTVTFTLDRDPNSDPAGTNGGFPRLHAPDPVAPGSSISHWTTEATPNLLMEPNITSGLEGVDITTGLFQDIGWTLSQAQAGTPRLIYPWLSFNDQFDTIFVLNNPTASEADVTLTGQRASGGAFTANITVPAGGFFESPIDQVFAGLGAGSGFSVVAESDTDGIQGRWVTRGLQSASGDSPSQGVAFELDGAGVGNALLFGYMPSSDTVISAPVIVNAGASAADVTLYFYGEDGTLLGTDTSSVAGLESYRPFAAPITNLIDAGQNVTMIAHSPSQNIAGAVFVFNLNFLEPAIGSAQVIDFTPP